MTNNKTTDTGPSTALEYSAGFGNEHITEAVTGALPVGQNSPQRAPLGLYAEKFSATAFTAPRAHSFRSWLYRIRPSVNQGEFEHLERGLLRNGPLREATTPPNAMRWNPFPVPDAPTDFIAGWVTLAANGDPRAQQGVSIHLYLANRSMQQRYFYNSDGELLLVPQQGGLRLRTEFGVLEVAPGEIALLPRGVKFAVDLLGATARGFIAENHGTMLALPELGPIGSDGLANPRDFLAPVAAYEEREETVELVAKFGGELFRTELDHSPLDVVAWHGGLTPYKYNLTRFNTMGSISYDHPDPSIFTVLTSQSDTAGTANLDFVIFPPRWLVMEDTFRPPWFHRNVMSEFMGLIYGEYDAKPDGGFVPGGSSLHNTMVPHGPDRAAFEKASAATLEPEHLGDTLAFMFESRYLLDVTSAALDSPHRQWDYLASWRGLERSFPRPR